MIHENVNTALPKYASTAATLRVDIQSGRYPPGSQLPPERELCQTFKIANHTLRRALTILEQEGAIRREHGRGTFVSEDHRSSQSKRWKALGKQVALFGIGPISSDWHDPANWEVRMRRYQGIVEAGFRLGMPVVNRSLPPLPAKHALEEWVKREFEGCGGVLQDYDSEEILPDPVIEELLRQGIPVVTIGRHENPICSDVHVDIAGGTRALLEHLIILGHRRIAMLTGAPNVYIHLREQAYARVLEEHEIPYDPGIVLQPPNGLPGESAKSVRALVELPQRPTAIFAANDLRAIGAIQGVKECGLRVPEDIAVVGFDDIAQSSKCDPSVTTLYNPVYEAGAEALKLLQEVREASNPANDIRIRRLSPRLVVRQSCGAKTTAAYGEGNS